MRGSGRVGTRREVRQESAGPVKTGLSIVKKTVLKKMMRCEV
jgi:hypothetical protein